MSEKCGAVLGALLFCRLAYRQDRLFLLFSRGHLLFFVKRKSLPPSFPVFLKQKLSRLCELLRSVSTVALSLGNLLSEGARELLEVSLLLIKWNSWIVTDSRFYVTVPHFYTTCVIRRDSLNFPCVAPCICIWKCKNLP